MALLSLDSSDCPTNCQPLLGLDVGLIGQLIAPFPSAGESSAHLLAATIPTEELRGPHAPISSASSNNLEALTQETTRVIRIPIRLILNIMLQELGLPEAEYHLEKCENSENLVTVRFHTSMLSAEGSPVYRLITGIKSTSYEVSEDCACEQVIRILEEATNTVITDLSYSELMLAKWKIIFLFRRLIKAEIYKKKLARGWFLAVRHMSSFSRQILSITNLNRSPGQEHFDVLWNNLLNNFEDLGFRLKHAGAVLEKHVEKMRHNYFY